MKSIFKILALLIVLSTIFYHIGLIRETVEQPVFDLLNDNPAVNTELQQNSILGEFDQMEYADLPQEYKHASRMSDVEYDKLLSGMKFYRLTKEDSYQKIVGDFRIKDFVAKDYKYKQSSYWNGKEFYWGINPKILRKLLELKAIFAEENLNWNQLSISSGHRTPLRNEQVGGASKSRHLFGEAVDMRIGDVNRDGQYTEEDKALVLKICEERVIKDQGGIGKYPGTRVIHIDVRGYKARWNTY